MGRPWVRPLLVAVLVVAVLLTATTGLAALQVSSASDDLTAAIDLIDQASLALEEGEIDAARESLDGAYTRIRDVNSVLYGPAEVQLSAGLPLVGENIDAVRDGVALALRLIDGGRRILRAAAPLAAEDGSLEVSLEDGSLPLDAVEDARREISALLVNLPGRPPTLPGTIIGPVRDASDRLQDEADRRRQQLGVLDRGLGLLTELAGGNGPRRYLIAVANPAEMRGAGGMILNYGVLEGTDGQLDLSAFGRIDEVALDAPVDERLVPADYLARWEGFDPLLRWRNATMAGDFTVVAPVLQAMYEASTGDEVDGVLQVDPVGLAALLDGVGPIQVPEVGTVDGTNVVALTLNEAYRRYPGIDQRSDLLGDIAEAAFERLVDGDLPSLRPLATRLVDAIEGRHLMVRSDDPSSQLALVDVGAHGGLPPVDGQDALMLTAQNLAGNKLDYYLDSTLAVTGDRPPGRPGELELTVELSNTAPVGEVTPQYIFGPGPTEVPLPAGVERVLATVYLPLGSSLTASEGPTLEPVTSGAEAGRPYVSFTTDIPAGATRTVVIRVAVPPRPAGPYQLILVPSPFVRPTTATIDVAVGDGTVAADVSLDRTWRVLPGEGAVTAVAPAFG